MVSVFHEIENRQISTTPKMVELSSACSSTTLTELMDPDCLDGSKYLLTPTTLVTRFNNHSSKHSKTSGGRSASKAAQCLLLKSTSSFSKNRTKRFENVSVLTSEAVDILTIDDRFYRDLNRCTPNMLDYLRRQRSDESPIICHESDDCHDDIPSLSTECIEESYCGVTQPNNSFLRPPIGGFVYKNYGSNQLLQHVAPPDVSPLDTQFSKFRVSSRVDSSVYPMR